MLNKLKNQVLQFRVDIETVDALDDLANEQKTTRAHVARIAVVEYIERKQKEKQTDGN